MVVERLGGVSCVPTLCDGPLIVLFQQNRADQRITDAGLGKIPTTFELGTIGAIVRRKGDSEPKAPGPMAACADAKVDVLQNARCHVC